VSMGDGSYSNASTASIDIELLDDVDLQYHVNRIIFTSFLSSNYYNFHWGQKLLQHNLITYYFITSRFVSLFYIEITYMTKPIVISYILANEMMIILNVIITVQMFEVRN